jgi:hypothetical protein
MCVCVSPAWQNLGAQPCRVNIVLGCAGLGSLASKAEIVQGWGAGPSEMELLQGCAGLGGCVAWRRLQMSVDPWPYGLVPQRSSSSEGWELGLEQPWWGKRARLEDWRSRGVCSRSSAGLWGRDWCAAPATLLVYGGWRGLPGSRGSECWCFSSPWCFTSFKQVSNFLSKSLYNGGQKVCGCVPVIILDLQEVIWDFLNIVKLLKSKCSNYSESYNFNTCIYLFVIILFMKLFSEKCLQLSMYIIYEYINM